MYNLSWIFDFNNDRPFGEEIEGDDRLSRQIVSEVPTENEVFVAEGNCMELGLFFVLLLLLMMMSLMVTMRIVGDSRG
jgi:hypothetical protein